MATKELTKRPAGSLALDPGQTSWTDVQRAALVQLGLDNAPDADLAVFLHFAQRTGLDPFAKQIYMIARWDHQANAHKYTIQAAIDGLRIVAERHGQYGGQIGPEWCGADGVWRDVWLANTPPVAARIGVIRRDWSTTMFATAHFAEFAGTTKDRSLTRMWRDKGSHMVAKCAEALALRKAFPQDLSGVYTDDEMSQADSIQVESERAEVPRTMPQQRSAPDPIDWDAKIAEAGTDVAALRALYELAKGIEPGNLALAERLAAAGKAAKAAAEAEAPQAEPNPPAEPAEPHDQQDDTGVQDAEVVQDEPPRVTKKANEQQLTAVHAALNAHGVTEREAKLAVLSHIVGERVASSKDLFSHEATSVLAELDAQHKEGRAAELVASALAQWQSARPETAIS
ncbi:phage recombination protein Bet [Amycolatopsis sp. H20-H5]|uniref:phage recombination protein Bet n=1 Tax=Amycolatopsis sp. H20-H5 TaxID=3046309 RepID=UPI002DBA8D18|nr:phage recombination protein Bet [Amycolatopsis sp. H20-H5]MEC3977875.1 phage recombination protein Bet [Amycolatopsis sp. H20-H5]